MFAALAEAVEALEVPVDGRSIAAALALRDRLEAKVIQALGPFDAAELWDLDAATSLTAWLRVEADQSPQGGGAPGQGGQAPAGPAGAGERL